MSWHDDARAEARVREAAGEIRRAARTAGLHKDATIARLASTPNADSWDVLLDRMELAGVDVEGLGLRGPDALPPTTEVRAACAGLDPGGQWAPVRVVTFDAFANAWSSPVSAFVVGVARGMGSGFDLVATFEVPAALEADFLAGTPQGARVEVYDAGVQIVTPPEATRRGAPGERFAFRHARSYRAPTVPGGAEFVRMLGDAIER